MNILIDIGHPAHVHYYRNMAVELKAKGHEIIWIVKDIKVAKELLDFYGFDYYVLPKKAASLVGKIFMQLYYDIQVLLICKQKRINLAIGTSVSIVHISKITTIKSIVFDDDDDDVQPLVTKFVNPYANTLLSPDALKGKRKRKETIYYPGYHELAYLHPNRFKPDPTVIKAAGLVDEERFFILRFNAFKAHHDKGIMGLSLNQKLELLEVLKPYGRILITTEGEIDPELKQFQLGIRPENIHSLLAYASLFIGDSQTMASEAAVLGTPSLRCSAFSGRISYLNEQEMRYGLTYGFLPDQFTSMIDKIYELLAMKGLKEEWKLRRSRMLQDKIDVTSFWVWFIDNYPESINSNKYIQDQK